MTELTELKKNVEEFLETGKESFQKGRYNASVSLLFKAVATYCDVLLYKKFSLLVTNHKERFEFLDVHYPEISKTVKKLYKMYRKSYTIRIGKEEAEEFKQEVDELVERIREIEEKE